MKSCHLALVLCVAFLLGGTAQAENVAPESASPLAELDIYNLEQPRCFAWRMENLGTKTYDYWYATVNQGNGYAPKMFAEEVTAWADIVRARINRYAQERPRQLLLCHFNGRDLKVMHFEGTDAFFPGHWAYLSGTWLTEAIDESERTLHVVRGNRFRAVDPGGAGNDVAVLVPVDARGTRQWYLAEFVVVRAVAGNQLTVDRGMFKSRAMAFPAGSYIAPLQSPSGFQADNTCFRYNLATSCPQDDRGRTCADVLVDLFGSWFDRGGPLERVHGLAFDVLFNDQGAPLALGSNPARKFDGDADGIADNGYDERGKDLWALGVYDFNRQLRRVLGPQRILTGDGNGSAWPRLVGLWNGMESESLTRWNDPYAKEWSSNINLFQYWQQHTAFAFPLNFIVMKYPTLDGSTPQAVQRNLVALTYATAAVLDLAATASGPKHVESDKRYSLYDELQKGIHQSPNWLGPAVGPLLRLAKETPDRLEAAGVRLDAAFVDNWTSPDGSCRIGRQGESLGVRGNPVTHTHAERLHLTYPGLTIGPGDLFLRFQVRAEKLTYFPTDVPRYLTVTVNGRRPSNDTAEALQALAGPDDYAEVAFFYRAAGPATVDVHLEFEGRQNVYLKAFTAHQAPDVLAREFKNGVVLANPSERPFPFNLAALFPGTSLARLSGNTWDDPDTNNGTAVGDTVTVPARSGLFLLKGRGSR